MINPNKSANKRRNRKYHLIFNNPEQHDGCSHQAIKEKLSGWENIVYWCMCDEIANAPHTHLYVQFKHPIYFNHMKEVFPSAHIEEAQGTAEENRAYIRKEGKWQDTEKARLEIQSNRYRSERRLDLKVIYVSGSTGLGKTRNILDSHGDDHVYRVTDYKHPFDTYSGEDVLVFEEFRSDLPIGSMLNYLDVYPLQLPARYNNRQACYHFVYIVSNWELEDQYHNVYLEQPETWKAFIRRIHSVRIYTAFGKWEEYLNRFQKTDGKDTPFSNC